DSASARLTLHGDTLRLDDGSALARGLRANATGTVDLQRETLDATITAAGDVAGAARGVGADVTGALTTRATVRGPLRQLAVDGTLTAENVRSGLATLQRGVLTATLTGVGGDTPAGRLSADLRALRVEKSSPWTGIVAADLQRAGGTDDAAVRIDGRAEDGGRLVAPAAIRRVPTGAVSVDLRALTATVPDHGTWTLVRPASLAVRTGTVSVDRLELAAGSQHVALAGRAGRSGPADATLDWTDVDGGALCRLQGLEGRGPTRRTGQL